MSAVLYTSTIHAQTERSSAHTSTLTTMAETAHIPYDKSNRKWLQNMSKIKIDFEFGIWNFKFFFECNARHDNRLTASSSLFRSHESHQKSMAAINGLVAK